MNKRTVTPYGAFTDEMNKIRAAVSEAILMWPEFQAAVEYEQAEKEKLARRVKELERKLQETGSKLNPAGCRFLPGFVIELWGQEFTVSRFVQSSMSYVFTNGMSVPAEIVEIESIGCSWTGKS